MDFGYFSFSISSAEGSNKITPFIHGSGNPISRTNPKPGGVEFWVWGHTVSEYVSATFCTKLWPRIYSIMHGNTPNQRMVAMQKPLTYADCFILRFRHLAHPYLILRETQRSGSSRLNCPRSAPTSGRRRRCTSTDRPQSIRDSPRTGRKSRFRIQA